MPIMSALEAAFCRSAPWDFVVRRVVPWAMQGNSLTGDVLEIGGGSGAIAEQLARSHPLMNQTTTDFDPAMVEIARTRLAEFPSAHAGQADATRLPFADGSFDTVVSFLMLHHVLDWEQSIAEAARVLRPGGTLIGYDLTASRLASWVHLVDRSPHRLIERGALEPVLSRADLEAEGMRYSFGGRVVRFVACKHLSTPSKNP